MESVFDQRPTVYEDFELSLRSELASMKLPPSDISCNYSADYLKFFPLLSVRDPYNPIEFIINSDSNSYLDLSDSFMHVVARVRKGDDSVVDDNTVCPSNLFFQLMIKNVEIYINSVLIYDSSNYYAHIAYLQRLLTTTDDVKLTELKNELFYPDKVVESYTANSEGFKKRTTFANGSHQFTMLGRIVAGIFNQKSWLPPGTQVRIVMRRNPPDFCLDSTAVEDTGSAGAKIKRVFKYELDEVSFLVSRKPVSGRIMELHRSLLEKNHTFKFVTNESYVKTIQVPRGMTSVVADNIIMGPIPKIIVIGCVKSSAMVGSLTESPMNFAHSNLKQINLSWNADTVENRVVPLNFSTTSNTIPDNFLLGLQSLKKAAPDGKLSISRDEYKNGKLFIIIISYTSNTDNEAYTLIFVCLTGNCLVAFELLPVMNDALSINRRGSVKLSLEYRESTTVPLTVIIYCMYQRVIEIDANRNVLLDSQ